MNTHTCSYISTRIQLFPDLTVEEHLKLFASFKGSRGKAMREEVEAMISAVGLTEKRRARSKV